MFRGFDQEILLKKFRYSRKFLIYFCISEIKKYKIHYELHNFFSRKLVLELLLHFIFDLNLKFTFFKVYTLCCGYIKTKFMWLYYSNSLAPEL